MICWPQAGAPGGGPLYSRGPTPTQEAPTEPATEPLLEGFGRSRRVLVAGATGFVGRHLVHRLLARGHEVRALARRAPESSWAENVEACAADIRTSDALAGLAEGCDAVVHLVSVAWPETGRAYEEVHVRGTVNLLEEALRAGVRRFVYVSALGASPSGNRYYRTKYEAEQRIRDSGVDFVIFRPSVIYGPGDRFTTALVTLLERLPVFPVLGLSASRLQPVAIEDVADALAQAVERPDVGARTFEIAGPERLEFKKIVRIVARTIGVRRPIVRLPSPLGQPALWIAARLGLPQPITPDQLAMFRGASVLRRGTNPLRSVFRLEPLPFRVAVEDYL